jgi:hypothetical protein
MGRRLLIRTLPLGDWQSNLARFCFAVDAGYRFARGRLDGNVSPCCRGIARYAVVGQVKNRSPVHLLARFRTRPHEVFRLARAHPGKVLRQGHQVTFFEACRDGVHLRILAFAACVCLQLRQGVVWPLTADSRIDGWNTCS